MNERPTLRQQIDACRADSDDLHLPEHAADLAELKAGVQQSAEIRAWRERSQRDDRAIRGAMQDVALPAGLEKRLLAAVQAAQERPLACVAKATAEETPAQAVVSVANAGRTPARSRRRWLMTTVGSLTVVAALMLSVFLGIKFLASPDEPITKDQLASQVQEWLQAAERMSWDARKTADRFPSGSLLGGVVRSGSVASSQGTITVYDVKLPTGSSRALVWGLPATAEYPVASLPFSNVSVSGGWEVGAWQKDGVLYVLAVRSGGDAGPEQFIRPQVIG